MKLFDFSGVKLNWFPGHMATGLKQIRSRIQNEKIDLIIEVRDARIPSASGNTEVILSEKTQTQTQTNRIELITVFNKSDLVERSKFTGQKENSILFCKDDRKDLRKLFQMVQSKLQSPDPLSNSITKKRVMVVGIPNVGKSTIINGLRMVGTGQGGKAVKVGNLAGVTKSLSELVCISRSPLIYLIDTPGILAPKITNVQDGLKVALCGGFYDKTVGVHLLASFLLHNLNEQKETEAYANLVSFYNLTEGLETQDLKTFLPVVGKRIGALLPGGEIDLERAAGFFVKQFRSGKLGKLSLKD